MIIVYYFYRASITQKYEKCQKTFNSVISASRFCWSMKKNWRMILDGWACDYPEDNEEMNKKVSIAKVNGWHW